MKKFVICLIALLAIVPVPAHASATSFLFGLALGSAGSRAGQQDKEIGTNNSQLVYELPRLLERVKDPLAVRFVSTYSSDGCYWGNRTLRENFSYVFDNPKKALEQFEILEVRFTPEKGCSRVFHFFYIEKNQVIPLRELPSQ